MVTGRFVDRHRFADEFGATFDHVFVVFAHQRSATTSTFARFAAISDAWLLLTLLLLPDQLLVLLCRSHFSVFRTRCFHCALRVVVVLCQFHLQTQQHKFAIKSWLQISCTINVSLHYLVKYVTSFWLTNSSHWLDFFAPLYTDL